MGDFNLEAMSGVADGGSQPLVAPPDRRVSLTTAERYRMVGSYLC